MVERALAEVHERELGQTEDCAAQTCHQRVAAIERQQRNPHHGRAQPGREVHRAEERPGGDHVVGEQQEERVVGVAWVDGRREHIALAQPDPEGVLPPVHLVQLRAAVRAQRRPLGNAPGIIDGSSRYERDEIEGPRRVDPSPKLDTVGVRRVEELRDTVSRDQVVAAALLEPVDEAPFGAAHLCQAPRQVVLRDVGDHEIRPGSVARRDQRARRHAQVVVARGRRTELQQSIARGLHGRDVLFVDLVPGAEARAGARERIAGLPDEARHRVGMAPHVRARDNLGLRWERVEENEPTGRFALAKRCQACHPDQEGEAPVRAIRLEETRQLAGESIGKPGHRAPLFAPETQIGARRRPASRGTERQGPVQDVERRERGREIPVPAREGVPEARVAVRGNLGVRRPRRW